MRETQSRRVYARLKEEILEWKLVPGTPLPEPDLAQRLGSSRTPVREALQQLAHEGLVRSIPGRGAFVADISVQDVIELYQMAEILEVGAARLAARSPARDALTEVRERLVEGAAVADDDNPEEYYEAVVAFDNRIAELAGSQRLKRALNDVWSEMRRLRHISASDFTRRRSTLDEHLAILDAILAGDGDTAGKLTEEHLIANRKHALESIVQRLG